MWHKEVLRIDSLGTRLPATVVVYEEWRGALPCHWGKLWISSITGFLGEICGPTLERQRDCCAALPVQEPCSQIYGVPFLADPEEEIGEEWQGPWEEEWKIEQIGILKKRCRYVEVALWINKPPCTCWSRKGESFRLGFRKTEFSPLPCSLLCPCSIGCTWSPLRTALNSPSYSIGDSGEKQCPVSG